MPANLNRKQQREIKAVVEKAKKDNGVPQTAQQSEVSSGGGTN